MNQLFEPAAPPLRESADAKLAKNLVVARVISGITQQELADAAGISRATVAQIETGSSDPRLSTIVELAKALGISPILLLVGTVEVNALASLNQNVDAQESVDSLEVARMRQYVETGMLKDRVRAARIGADAVESISATPVGPIAAGLFSAIYPGAGTDVGARLGDLLSQANTQANAQPPQTPQIFSTVSKKRA
jgi:transcriptional regulator with XRE-family HTH domain